VISTSILKEFQIKQQTSYHPGARCFSSL